MKFFAFSKFCFLIFELFRSKTKLQVSTANVSLPTLAARKSQMENMASRASRASISKTRRNLLSRNQTMNITLPRDQEGSRLSYQNTRRLKGRYSSLDLTQRGDQGADEEGTVMSPFKQQPSRRLTKEMSQAMIEKGQMVRMMTQDLL